MIKNKIIAIIVALIIILGITIVLTSGFNVDMMTKKHSQIKLNIEKDFSISEIKNITDEVLKNQEVVIQKVGKVQQTVMVSTSKITENQKKDLVKKINEKYETKLEAKNINTESIPKVKLQDIVTPYFWTFVLSTIIVIAFMLIVGTVYKVIVKKKIGALGTIIRAICNIIIIELVTLSLLVIARIPVGSNLPSILFTAFIIGVYMSTVQMFKKYNKISLEEKAKEE